MAKSDTERRLLFVLHRGLIEARELARLSRTEELIFLTDVLELIPGYLDRENPETLEVIRVGLKDYRDRFPNGTFDYIRCLDVDPLPDRF